MITQKRWPVVTNFMNHVLLDGVLQDQIVLYVAEVFYWEEEEQHQLQIEEYQDRSAIYQEEDARVKPKSIQG